MEELKLKKWISFLLSISMMAAMLPTVVFADSKFSDVKDNEYYAQAANSLSEMKILEGYEDGSFGAEKPVTRAEMAAIMCRMLGKAAASNKETQFGDVSANHWAAGYINTASSEKIIEGDGNGSFRPEDNVKYEEAIKMTVCALGLGEGAKQSTGDWSAGYIAVANANNITANLKGSKGQASVRGDIAVMIYNGLTKDIKKPTASKAGGRYTSGLAVEISTKTEGAEIYYTTDGSKPTADSHKYTQAIKISKTTTLKAVTVVNKVLVSDEFTAEYTIGDSSRPGGSGGGGGSSSGSQYTVSFDLNYEGATDTPASQSVKKGEYAKMPDDPERNGYAFMGWHKKDTEIDIFDFENTAVNSNLKIFAHWVDTNDTTDTDGDGLTDSFEYYFGTDKTKSDTDIDGLNDYFELYILNTDPLKTDTDNNGITDNLEDADDDKINNADEYSIGTNAIYYDTDHDLLSDYDEINIYRTDPLKEDTDEDGVKDGDEVAIGSNPLALETSFKTKTDFGEPTKDNPVSIKVEAITDADGAGSLEAETVRWSDNCLISDSIAGYLGYAYDLKTEGNLKEAELIFEYDTALGAIGDDFQPRIYYLNEVTGEFEELPGQIVTDGKVIAKTTHFSTYILLNKVEFDKVWDTEIKAPTQGESQISSIDVAFVIDSSGSMSGNDSRDLRKTLTSEMIKKLTENDRAAVVDFDDYARVFSEFTNDKNVLQSAVKRIDSSGGTAIYTGIGSALNLFDSIATDDDSDKLKVMFVLTDGEDNYTSYDYSNLVQRAVAGNIQVYTVGLGTSINEALLKDIAAKSNGKYYHATTATDLGDVFDDFELETIDYTTDSNNDGISDYYTKLINDGSLCLTNSSDELAGCTDIFGEESADWDGDGILNGEEIEIIVGSNNKPKIKMNSHPFWADYDSDGYDDYTELKIMKTDPLKYTLPYSNEYNKLIGDASTIYYSKLLSDNYADNWFNAGLINIFDWNKTKESEQVLIDYFYDYASQESISANAEAIAKQAKSETVIEAVNNILKITKNLKGITDYATGISELDRKQEKVKNFKYNVFKGLPEIFKCANKKDTETALNLVSDAIKDIQTGAGLVEDFNTTAEDILGKVEDNTNDALKILKIGKNVFNLMYKDGKMVNLPVPKAFSKFSKKYTKWMDKEAFGGINNSQLIGMTFDVVDLAANSAELYTTYAKLQANTEAYSEYIECIDYISENGNGVDFVKDAAGKVMKIVLEDGNFMQEYANTILQDSAKTFISIGTDVLSKIPYVAAIKTAIDLGISLSGVNKLSEGVVKSLMADSISDSFIYMMDSCVSSKNDIWFSVSGHDEAIKYLTQLAQSRIYGENIAKDFYSVKSISTFIADIIHSVGGNMTQEEMLDDINKNIKNVYTTSKKMNLVLSPNLPGYLANNSSGGGGAW